MQQGNAVGNAISGRLPALSFLAANYANYANLKSEFNAELWRASMYRLMKSDFGNVNLWPVKELHTFATKSKILISTQPI